MEKKYECYYKLSSICACTMNIHANDGETRQNEREKPANMITSSLLLCKAFFSPLLLTVSVMNLHSSYFHFFLSLDRSCCLCCCCCWSLDKCKTMEKPYKIPIWIRAFWWIGNERPNTANNHRRCYCVVQRWREKERTKNVPNGNEIIKLYFWA